MSIFLNKDKFADRPEVLKLLEKLEKAHAERDELAAMFLLHKLKNDFNLIVRSEKND